MWQVSKVVNITVKTQTQNPQPYPEDPLKKEMATDSSSLAWRISWTEEPGELKSMGSQRAGHD